MVTAGEPPVSVAISRPAPRRGPAGLRRAARAGQVDCADARRVDRRRDQRERGLLLE